MRKVKHWVAGWNPEGYLPDPDNVLHGAELVEAVGYLKDELKRSGDETGDRDEAEAFDAARQRVSGWDMGDMYARARIHGSEANWVKAGGYRYWVQTCDVEDCKDVNAQSEE